MLTCQIAKSSAATSINSTKLPAVYSRVLPLASGKTIIDYGCGRYPEIIRTAAHTSGAAWYNYQGDALTASADIVICANVLNVIDSDAVIVDVLQAIAGYMRGDSVAYIAIYEGNKSGRRLLSTQCTRQSLCGYVQERVWPRYGQMQRADMRAGNLREFKGI